MEKTTNPRNYSPSRGPRVSRPELVSFFSIGKRGDYRDDFSELRYFRTPPGRVNFDLTRDLESAITKPESDDKLETILLNFMYHRKDFLFNNDKIFLSNVPFVSCRGLLRDMSALPYKNVDFRFSACLFRGILYLHYLDTPEGAARWANVSEKEKAMGIWGHKFEKYLLSDDPNCEPDTGSPADQISSFYSVMECHIGRHHLIYRAEMDGIHVERSSLKEGFHPEKHSQGHVLEKLKKLQFVELKTNRHNETKSQYVAFRRHKILSWWLQSFFGGVNTIVCGFRDNNGIVDEIKEYRTCDLPAQCSMYWNPNVCMNFCNELLIYIKDCFAREIQHMFGKVDNVRNLPKIELVFERLSGTSVRQTEPMPNENISVLEDWYIDMFPSV